MLKIYLRKRKNDKKKERSQCKSVVSEVFFSKLYLLETYCKQLIR